ncbi:MAG: hypothetical protein ACYCOR_09360 [Acidobacteriaceae bacterium]
MDDFDHNPTPIVLLLGGGLLFSSIFVALTCRLPLTASLTWLGVVGRATLYIAGIAMVHLVAIWGASHVFEEHVSLSLRSAFSKTWCVIAWLPALGLVVKAQSPWTAVLVLLVSCNASFVIAAHAKSEAVAFAEAEGATVSNMFSLCEQAPLTRSLIGSIFVAIAIQGGIVTYLAKHYLAAACFFALCPAFPIWNLSVKKRIRDRRWYTNAGIWSMLWPTLVGVLLVAVFLIPFLQKKHIAVEGEALLRMRRHGLTHGLDSLARHSEVSYVGIILTLPPRPHPRTIPPPPQQDAIMQGTPLKPRLIEFDGEYWFYKEPDTRPTPKAHIQRGNPLKLTILSTDSAPLMMKAHQALSSPIEMNCCRAFKVDVVNGDSRAGAISVGVILSDTRLPGSPQVGLKEIVLPSSTGRYVSLSRTPVRETLTFRLPPVSRLKEFNDIVIVITPAPQRNREAARVAIRDFILVP